MSRIQIALSPYVRVDEWKDDLSGITLKRSQRGEIVPVSVPEDIDFTNIRKAVRMNQILVLEGELPPEPKKAPKKEEAEEGEDKTKKKK